jgi:hypothetical protein
MNLNPSQFAFYLKSSSLNSDEQQAVLLRLPDMKEADVKTLFDRLKADHQAMAETLQSVHMKRQAITDGLAEQLKSS